MRRLLRFGLLFTSLMVLPAMTNAAPSALPAVRCTKAFSVGLRAAGQVYFLGKALADTIDAGPGTPRQLGTGGGHSGPMGPGAFRGQLVVVERLEDRAPAELKNTLGDSAGRAVLVAWDYDAACGPVPRVARADWMKPGAQGLFSGILRPREFWASGLPTLDVFSPEFEPYPFPDRRGGRFADANPATPEELFEFVSEVVEARTRDYIADNEGLYQRGKAWALEHPVAASRPPIAGTLEMARNAMLRGKASFHRIVSPLAGTWRIEVAIAGGDTLRFFARTAETPLMASYDSVGGRRLPDDAIERLPYSYELYVMFSRDEAKLDTIRSNTPEGYLQLVVAPLRESMDTIEWRGTLASVGMAKRLFAPIPSELFIAYLEAERVKDTTRFASLKARGLPDLWRQLNAAEFAGPFPDRFVQTRDGTVLGRREVWKNGVLLLTVTARRMNSLRFPGQRIPRAKYF